MGRRRMTNVGDRYNMLVVIDEAEKSARGELKYLCICDCGKESIVFGLNLRSGSTKSCGCLIGGLRHGHTSKRELSSTYITWKGINQRCNNPNSKNWDNYGGRGIKVCKRWEIFENFLVDMGERPLGKSIDRIDNDGNYEPGNCRWATLVEQRRNQRRYLLAHSTLLR